MSAEPAPADGAGKPSDEAHRAGALGVLALCFALHLLGRGMADPFGVFVLPIEQAFGGSRASVTGVFSAYLVCYGLAGPLVGHVFDRFGPRRLYTLGLAVLAICVFVSGLLDAIWPYYLSLGLGTGLAVAALGMVPASALLARWFRRRLATALAIAFSGFAAGSLVMVPLAQWLVETWGWRQAYRALGGLVGLLLFAVLLLPWPRITAGRASITAQPPSGAVGRDIGLRQAMRMRPFWALVQTLFFTGMMMFAVMVQTVAYLIEIGFPPMAAASAYGLCGSLSAVGIVASGWLGDRYGYRPVISASFLMTVTGIVLLIALASYRNQLLLSGFVLFFGLSQGARGPLVTALSARLFAGRGQAAIYGAITAGMGIGAAIGAGLSGYLHDLTGSYRAGLIYACLCAGLGLLPFWTVPALATAGRRAPEAG